jgi:hypothetical protein
MGPHSKVPPSPSRHPGDPLLIDHMVNDIYGAFNEACKAVMKTVGTTPGFNS